MPSIYGRGTLPVTITREDLSSTQSADEFFKSFWTTAAITGNKVVETEEYVLMRAHPYDKRRHQTIVPDVLRPIILNLSHQVQLSGHPGQKRMLSKIRETIYWS